MRANIMQTFMQAFEKNGGRPKLCGSLYPLEFNN